MQFFGCAMLSLVDELKQVLLQCLPRDVHYGQFSESGQQIGGTQPFIFFAGAFLHKVLITKEQYEEFLEKSFIG